MTRWIAMLAALGVFLAALPLEAAAPKRQISPVYAGKAPKGPVAAKKTKTIKPAKPRSAAQKSAQKKATKAAAAEMKRKGPTIKQREAQRTASRASAAKAKAKPNKRRA
jgi:hypothetical protein